MTTNLNNTNNIVTKITIDSNSGCIGTISDALINSNAITSVSINDTISSLSQYILDVKGKLKADDVQLNKLFGRKDVTVSEMFFVLINVLINNGLITKEQLIEQLDAIKVMEEITKE